MLKLPFVLNKCDGFNIRKTGYDEGYDVYGKNVVLTGETTSFEAVTKDGDSHKFTLNMIGEHNVLNALIGIQISKESLDLHLMKWKKVSKILKLLL